MVVHVVVDVILDVVVAVDVILDVVVAVDVDVVVVVVVDVVVDVHVLCEAPHNTRTSTNHVNEEGQLLKDKLEL